MLVACTMDDDVSDISNSISDFKDTSAGLNMWIGNLRTTANCKAHERVTKEKLMKQTKDERKPW